MLTAATVLGALVAAPGAETGASSVSSLQQEAAQLSQQMLLEQLQIGAFTEQRNAATAAASADEAALSAIQARETAARVRIAKDVVELRHAAVKAYVDGGTQADGVAALFASNTSAQTSGVYNQVMTGDLKTSVDHLESDRSVLHSEQLDAAQLAGQARQQLATASAALAKAQSIAQELQSQQSAVNGELAVAIAQQQAQQAAAARAAAQAAVAKAAPAPSTHTVSAPIATGGTPPLPVLPPFLRCVIQVESGGDYQAVSPTGLYMGAFQFAQGTWNEAAQLAGKSTLVGVPPNDAPPYDQNLLAIVLYNVDGQQPWLDGCHG